MIIIVLWSTSRLPKPGRILPSCVQPAVRLLSVVHILSFVVFGLAEAGFSAVSAHAMPRPKAGLLLLYLRHLFATLAAVLSNTSAQVASHIAC